MTRRARLAAFIVVLAGCSVLASTPAEAASYQFLKPIVQRSKGNPPPDYDRGYQGSQFTVTRGGTSRDYYYCPSGEGMSNWTVVADTADSNQHSWNTLGTSKYASPYFTVYVQNWSLAPVLYLRTVGTCMTNPLDFSFPFYKPDNGQVPGEYQDYWDKQFGNGVDRPTVAAYAGLIRRAFCWGKFCGGNAPDAAASRVHGLRNGVNKIVLTFKHSTGRRPPMVRLAGADGCSSRAMNVRVRNGAGRLALELRCRGLKRGAEARVKIGKAIVRHFPLRRGNGTIRVGLDRPPGTVEPLVHLSYGKGTPCASRRHKLTMRSKEYDLRTTVRCGKGVRNATGHLYVGGLQAADK